MGGLWLVATYLDGGLVECAFEEGPWVGEPAVQHEAALAGVVRAAHARHAVGQPRVEAGELVEAGRHAIQEAALLGALARVEGPPVLEHARLEQERLPAREGEGRLLATPVLRQAQHKRPRTVRIVRMQALQQGKEPISSATKGAFFERGKSGWNGHSLGEVATGRMEGECVASAGSPHSSLTW